MPESNSPFFIVGNERSGTTLLMAILGHHSRLAVPEVAWYYPRFRPYLHSYGELSRTENFRTLLSEMIFGLKTPFFGLDWNPRSIVQEVLESTRENTFAEAYRGILQRYAEGVKKPRWGEKTPHNLFYVREILQDFPDAKFLNLVRDGRDVAVEQLRSAFGPRNAYSAALIWRRSQELAEHWSGALSQAQWLDVSYEELARDPEPVLRRVTSFLQEDYEPQVLEFHRGELARRRAQTRDHRALGGPVSTDYVGLYRRHLSSYEQGVFGQVAGAALERAGYSVEVPPVAISEQEASLFLELDARIRAATLDAPEGHVVYESYNDWLSDQREQRRRRGLWTNATPLRPFATEEPLFDWDEEFISGQRAPRKWKDYFAVKRRYHGTDLVL